MWGSWFWASRVSPASAALYLVSESVCTGIQDSLLLGPHPSFYILVLPSGAEGPISLLFFQPLM